MKCFHLKAFDCCDQKHLTAVTMKFYLINFTTMVSEAFLINYSQIFCAINAVH